MAPKKNTPNTKKPKIVEDVAQSGFFLSPETKRSIWVIFLSAFALLSALALAGAAGMLGNWVGAILKQLFGWGAYFSPIVAGLVAYGIWKGTFTEFHALRFVGMIVACAAFLALLHLPVAQDTSLQPVIDARGGGFFGFIVSIPLLAVLGSIATPIVLIAVGATGALLATNLSFLKVKKAVEEKAKEVVEDMTEKMEAKKEAKENPETQAEVKPIPEKSKAVKPKSEEEPLLAETPAKRLPRIDLPLELLSDATGKPKSGDIESNKEKIQRTLATFNIPVEMDEVNVGPTVTQYALKPADGVKLASILALQNDLAMSLAAHPLRIEAPIPGKSLVGIEVPNRTVASVYLKEVLISDNFRNRKSNLAIALGKDVSGTARITQLEKMPHMLIAGATGSGKSVCINTIILSLLYQNHAEDLRLILVDPKRVEFTPYNDIPHLLTPVITDVKRTINALRWCVNEMDRRYEVFAQYGHRNITAFNSAHPEEKMPYIVLIIDELADLMAVSAKEVEAYIIRLAQMARAVGIHIIVATQRPSVNVITGLIKANITSRIAFAVASQIDSRTIIDTAGAEKLLGRGDMLFISSEQNKPTRIQGVYVSDDEVREVVSYLKERGGEPKYDETVIEKQGPTSLVQSGVLSGEDVVDEGSDPLLEEAKDIIVKSGKASASLLQRRLRVGYSRAARILDLLEEEGFIGPSDGARAREVLGTTNSGMSVDHSPNSIAEGGPVTTTRLSNDYVELEPELNKEQPTAENTEEYASDEDEIPGKPPSAFA